METRSGIKVPSLAYGCRFEVIRGEDSIPNNCKMVEEASVCCDGPERESDYTPLMVELRRKINLFRDVIDLPEFESASLIKLVVETMMDLHKLYPESVREIHQVVCTRRAGTPGIESKQGLACFSATLKSIGDLLKIKDAWIDEVTSGEVADMNDKDLNESVGIALKTLNALIKLAKERFEMMGEDEQDLSPRRSVFEKILDSPMDCKSTGTELSPDTPTSVLPETNHNQRGFAEVSYTPPLLLRLRVRSVGKLNPIVVKRFFSANSVPGINPPVENTTVTPPETQETSPLPLSPTPTLVHSLSIQALPPSSPPPTPTLGPSVDVRLAPPPPTSLPNKGLPSQLPASPPPPPPCMGLRGPPPCNEYRSRR